MAKDFRDTIDIGRLPPTNFKVWPWSRLLSVTYLIVLMVLFFGWGRVRSTLRRWYRFGWDFCSNNLGHCGRKYFGPFIGPIWVGAIYALWLWCVPCIWWTCDYGRGDADELRDIILFGSWAIFMIIGWVLNFCCGNVGDKNDNFSCC